MRFVRIAPQSAPAAQAGENSDPEVTDLQTLVKVLQ